MTTIKLVNTQTHIPAIVTLDSGVMIVINAEYIQVINHDRETLHLFQQTIGYTWHEVTIIPSSTEAVVLITYREGGKTLKMKQTIITDCLGKMNYIFEGLVN